MVWIDEHNEMLVHEMYLFEPWKYKKGSQQRRNIRQQISDSLNDLENLEFNVTHKSDVETAKAVEMRQSSMETLAETRKRKAEGSCDGGNLKEVYQMGLTPLLTCKTSQK